MLNCDYLEGKTVTDIKIDGDRSIDFVLSNGETVRMAHEQDCCELVYISDICGDIKDLIGSPLLQAEESKSDMVGFLTEEGKYNWVEHIYSEEEKQRKIESNEYDEWTLYWTFYKFATIKGYVTIRWNCSTNSCYSTDVSFFLILPFEEGK
jgi:hypothetical protein